MAYDDDIRVEITVLIPGKLRAAFAAALTGNDDDLVLAAEQAIRDRLDADGSFESIELSHGRDLADEIDPRHVRDEPEMPICGCGAKVPSDCAAGVEGYFTSLGQRSDDQLQVLHEGDGCEAAGLTLRLRRAAAEAEV